MGVVRSGVQAVFGDRAHDDEGKGGAVVRVAVTVVVGEEVGEGTIVRAADEMRVFGPPRLGPDGVGVAALARVVARETVGLGRHGGDRVVVVRVLGHKECGAGYGDAATDLAVVAHKCRLL